jgi:outer membrane protein assembly factor BamB
MRSILLLCVLALPLHAQESSDWPQFRGSTGQGVSPDRSLPTTWSQTENIVWKKELPGSGTASPIIVGERIFVTSFTGSPASNDLKLHCSGLERATGRTIWTVEIEPRLPEQERIREDHGYASATPCSDGQRVFAFFGKTGLFAFDAASGKQLWKAQCGDGLNGWGSAASPILYEKLVIVNASVESESLMAFDQETGKEVWRVKGIKESWNTPILVKVGEKTELVVAIIGKILGLDPKTGEQLWSCATDITWYMVPSLLAHEGVVYALGGRSGVAGLAVKAGGKGDVTNSHRLWTSRKGSNVTSPIFHNGHLYWMHENLGTVFCAEAASGKIVYEQRVPGADQVYASPFIADGKIYQFARNGKAFVIAAKPEYEVMETIPALERGVLNATPAVAGSRIYLRVNKTLYCIGTK